MGFIEKVNLEGENVLLIPIEFQHKKALLNAAADGELWSLKVTSIPDYSSIDEYMENALSEYSNKDGLSFVIVYKKTGTIIGTTRFTNVSPQDRRVEIGYTWYSKSFQRTGVNTECKYLMLCHAFEHLHCIAVEFRTHNLNFASQNAILRLGAIKDGILRKHKIMKDGTIRDTVVFSITSEEWPRCKSLLEYLMYEKYIGIDRK